MTAWADDWDESIDWSHVDFVTMIRDAIAERAALQFDPTYSYSLSIAAGLDVQKTSFWGGFQAVIESLIPYFVDPDYAGGPGTLPNYTPISMPPTTGGPTVWAFDTIRDAAELDPMLFELRPKRFNRVLDRLRNIHHLHQLGRG